jgi:serine protease Do
MKQLLQPLSIMALLVIPVSLEADDAPGDALAVAVRAAVAEVAPAVLRVETFGGLETVDGALVSSGPTTGLAVAEDGYLVASMFSFVQQPTSILVTLPSGKRAAAQVVARDHSRMLVLLKVNSDEKLHVPVAAPRGEMKVGQTAIAIGRTLDKNTPNVSVGILSAANRVWGKAIQTDGKISPSNYGGPLVDLRGRVLGVLVPMSPQGEGELAGAEWYDSGIGFAVPLADIMQRLELMKAGKDLKPGKLGVSLASSDDYQEPVEIAAALPGSPAAKAGWKKGDKIIDVAGVPVRWQAQLKHQLGPRYAGDTVEVTVLRGEEKIKKSVELVADIPPYDVPFLGILPVRDFAGEGVRIRYVYPGGPAAEAGLAAGDVILAFGPLPVKGAAVLRDAVGTHPRAAQPRVAIEYERGGKKIKAEVALASQPAELPGELPPALEAKPVADAQRPAVGLVEIKLPEERNNCFAYVPPSYQPAAPHGLVVWLHAAGEFDKAKLEPRWQAACEKHQLIVLAPQAADQEGWEPTEADFVRKAIDDVLGRYNIDRTRIAVHGYQGGGTFGALVAFAHHDLIRGVSLADAPLPRRAAPPASDPVERMAYLCWTAEKSQLKDRVTADINRLKEMKLPVGAQSLGDEPRPLNDKELLELARWLDALDRI